MSSLNRMKMQPLLNGVCIGIASSGRLCPLELVIAIQTQSWPCNTGVGWSVVCGAEVDDARNRIAETALENNAKYLWFVDDDTVPPPDAARKLMYVLEQSEVNGTKVAVASGIYGYKRDPSEPMVFLGPNLGPHWKWKQGDIFDCWGTGAGCMMIRTEVFKHIPKPWFKFIREPGHTEGEDLYFCNKVAEAGYRVVAHGGVLCRHWDMAEMKVYTLPDDSYPMTPALIQKPTLGEVVQVAQQ